MIDIYPTSPWNDDALVQRQSRAAYARLVNQGWTDAIRELHGDARIYTFWHYLRRRLKRTSWSTTAGPKAREGEH